MAEADAGKTLVVCCDGTWNRPRAARGPTNVAKVAIALAEQDGEGREQRLYYHEGVGVRRSERIRGGVTGWGLSRNVRECYRFLVESYEPGDRIYLFGFSRGAYTARSLAGLIRNSGLLRPQHVARIDEAYRLYRDRKMDPLSLEAELFRRMYAHPAREPGPHGDEREQAED
jgi:uncharacterized protein (DUF2235 family)